MHAYMFNFLLFFYYQTQFLCFLLERGKNYIHTFTFDLVVPVLTYS